MKNTYFDTFPMTKDDEDNIYWNNGKKIGRLVRMAGDGEWAFEPVLEGGVWTHLVLITISNYLASKNLEE